MMGTFWQIVVEGPEERPQSMLGVSEVDKSLHPKCLQGLLELKVSWQWNAWCFLCQLAPELVCEQLAEVGPSQPVHDDLEKGLVPFGISLVPIKVWFQGFLQPGVQVFSQDIQVNFALGIILERYKSTL